MKRFFVPSSLLLRCLLICVATSVRATTVDVGLGFGSNSFPFRPDYVGEYQEIYSSSAFPGSFLISAVAFKTGTANTAVSSSYNFTLSLGITSRTPDNPGSSYSGTFTPVFSGPRTVNFTSPGNFDFTVPLSTPFLYNPALGNLLMDITILSPSSDTAFFASSFDDPQLGRVFNSGGNGAPTADPNSGLETRFSGSIPAAPDGGSTALLFVLSVLPVAALTAAARR